jgi:hypothetical protein
MDVNEIKSRRVGGQGISLPVAAIFAILAVIFDVD